jgi:hypothetical protein
MYCALIPNLADWALDVKWLILIQTLVSSMFSLHWYSRINYSKLYSGSIAKVYAELDSIQFKYTQFVNLGVKTKPPFINGYFDADKPSKILSKRYDVIFFLVISIAGEFLIFLPHSDKLTGKKLLFDLLHNYFPYGKNMIAALGGYVFLVGSSLLILGFISRIIDFKDKKSDSHAKPT